ncbi:DNA endonuclease V [Synechococcus phage ACG-2014b]|jgi:hypothetical protein|uniref:DNA endonuclease V n=3 Tax=Synechococcus phage ACG-2014b TaxID=1493508 RepID=A0A0E3HUY0_9CAUD|nr:DNA endonuclease V [Synechococcus phage ACG-2014b]YP_009779665.1 DNA endonuclease V [Synechococcus phage ACG-2014b]YP_009779879.1 DNA endonuclease V [Synechococcus phage ACG-2014b]AIX17259.1 DNA endonuclease V [Synechococcus phage ACG-2014b]AIX17473.1 DNA endonuclease V [Synechococcus phage ACG-2014b]AIX17688.1 DNA endonuclease V [Synechococcus phage ACG-2014b]AIX17905.1 DNA endonuclease V [Synechococcus phage ACG-2014b]AIX18121.1 DNA endonuclease V [Synechococcus phage ACG-2014b]
MHSLVHEVENFLTEEELEVVNKSILSQDFSWYYQKESTVDLFPFFSHVIHPRMPEQDEEDSPVYTNSPLHYFVTPIVERYCQSQLGRPMQKIYRSSLNCTYGWNTPYPFTEPHIDHKFDHLNLIVYLNDDFEDGETLIFNKYFCEGMSECMYSVDDYDKVKILQKITPKQGKVSCFDGKLYHGMNNLKSGRRRVILVVTFK